MKKLIFPLCLLPLLCAACPVMDAAETIEVKGSVTIKSSMAVPEYFYYFSSAIHVYNADGKEIGKCVPKQQWEGTNYPDTYNDERKYEWSMPIVAKRNMPVKVWAEFRDYNPAGNSDILYYNYIDYTGILPTLKSATTFDLLLNAEHTPMIAIHNAKELAAIGKDPRFPADGNYMLIQNIELSGVWEPICQDTTASPAFTGSFDGQANVITGLKLPDDIRQYIGLFGHIKGIDALESTERNEVRNLRLELDPRPLSLTPVTGQAVGILAGRVSYTNITNISVSGADLEVARSGGDDIGVGGIVGRLNNAYLTQCSSTVTVKLTGNTAADHLMCAGGLVGLNGDAFSTGLNILTDCFSEGDIIVSNSVGGSLGGGIAGSLTGTMTIVFKTYAAGNVAVYGLASAGAGGITGGFEKTGGGYIGTSVVYSPRIEAGGSLAVNPTAFGIAGKYSGTNTIGTGNHRTDSTLFSPVATSSTSHGTGIALSSLNESFYRNTLQWDLDTVWKWDAAKNKPVLR
jgi:hypothetical protein